MTNVLAVVSSRDRSAPCRDRGEATAQLVILVPAVMLLLLIGVQSAAWFHAAHTASVVAAHGAAAGSTVNGGAGSAASAARSMARDLHARLDAGPSVDVSRDFVTVRVAVRVPRLVPFFPRRVTRVAVEPVERFRPESER